MASGSDYDTDRTHRTTDSPTDDAPWAELELTVPNDRSHASIVALVECALVELSHEPVAAEYVASNPWETKHIQFIAMDDVGELFQKRHFDDRLGYYETRLSRTAVRDELIARLSQSASSVPSEVRDGASDDPDRFCVTPVHAL